MIFIQARLTVKTEKIDTFVEKAQSLIAASTAETGNVHYELVKAVDQPNVFYMLEQWQDAAAVASHNESAHFKGFSEQSAILLEANPEITLLQPLKEGNN